MNKNMGNGNSFRMMCGRERVLEQWKEQINTTLEDMTHKMCLYIAIEMQYACGSAIFRILEYYYFCSAT